MSDRFLKKGEGWRLGWNPQAESYPALVGGDDWAMELTAAEFADFRRLLEQLSDTMTSMTQTLMESEKITCEAESELLWLEVEGYPTHYSLRLILHQERRCEGNWPETVVNELRQEVQRLTLF